MAPTLSIDKRFCGPPQSANGGYFVGRVNELSTQTLAVRLLKPPPLETEFEVVELPQGAIELRQGQQAIAQGRPAQLDLIAPPPPSDIQALMASRRYYGFVHHAFPTCFVCGPERTRGDGLRIFAGAVEGRNIVAAPWVPDPSLDPGDGKVAPVFLTAALDCPGYAAVENGKVMLLGELTAHIDRRVHIGERCVIVGWAISSDGRKHLAGTAIFDEDGELCARARALWVEPR
jgi:hypothetical protein